MKVAGLWFYRMVAGFLMFVLATPPGIAATIPQQQGQPAPQTAATQPVPQTAGPAAPEQAANDGPSSPLPDSPNPALSSAAPQSSSASQQASSSQSAPQQNGPAQPMGTAAAPYEPGTGIAASRPSGAAIAPARQKRTRSFVIKVGLLIAAGVAVGSVVALSSASPSRASGQ